MKLGKFIKQPSEVESYTIDYSDDLTAGDEIVSATVTVTPDGLENHSRNIRSDNVRMWFRGGVAGVKYTVEVTATTGDGRVLQDEFTIQVKEY